ncbi:carbohydrate ABC transporter permease [Micromonospora craniellae]|uniref:Sugar ABC transporter permease n=1 Tax=Micromonospora craniellae TaxID=2294034 RepID=A0A372FZU4_9ACTN|nr:sugar ABC transporter permease [Micromonospora craniellae]QOC91371.1 sugar ABC transporter permease [Micromonospora craniellae]RFS46302.1 sugar ABC transporter permease [Micromonospora craniellae]
MAATLTRPRPGRSRLVWRNTIAGWSFILPNFVGFALLTLAPVMALFYLAFTNWNVFGVAEWTGLANFRRMWGDASFWTALRNTLYYTVLHIPLTMAAALGLALLLNRRIRGVGFFRTAAFFPYITSIVAIAVVWNQLFSPEYGPVNAFLRAVGVHSPPGWTTSADWSMPAVVIVGTWREMGYYMLLFLAGLQTIPTQLYEAAKIDGATAWQRFRHVTIPGLRPTTFFVVVMLTIGSFKVFDLILVMTEGGPGQSTLVLSQYIYQKGFVENQFGYASAVSIVLFAICFGVTAVQFWINNRRENR